MIKNLNEREELALRDFLSKQGDNDEAVRRP
jgi:hypothetical protein